MPFPRLSGVAILKGVAIIPAVFVANTGTVIALRKTGLLTEKDIEKFQKQPPRH
jgi:hypothetical protein